jgi:protein-disulfide isomerase
MDKKDLDIQKDNTPPSLEMGEKKIQKILTELKKDILIYVAVFMAAGILINTLILNHFISKMPSGAPAQHTITVTEKDHIYGNKKAPIIIVEFSDAECPYCKMFHKTVKSLVDESNGTIAWVYKHYPLPIHPKAKKEAEAMECAGELGGEKAFFAYIDRLFEITPTNNGLDESELPKIATYIGLNEKDFMSCLDSGKYKTKVDEDYKMGRKNKVEGTPYSFIMEQSEDGTLRILETVNGALGKEALKEVIDLYRTE